MNSEKVKDIKKALEFQRDSLAYLKDNVVEYVSCKDILTYINELESKLGENSVVLTREEYEQLNIDRQCLVRQFHCEIMETVQQECKETARECVQELHNILWDEKVPASCTLINIDIKLRELAEQYGIEVEE